MAPIFWFRRERRPVDLESGVENGVALGKLSRDRAHFPGIVMMKRSFWLTLCPGPAVNRKAELLGTMISIGPHQEGQHLQSQAFFATVDSVLRQIDPSLIEVIRTPSFHNSSAAATNNRLYELLNAIADIFQKEQKHVFVGNLCDELQRRDLVMGDAGQKEKAAQLVFILFGVLTMLYTPETSPKEGQFQMRVNGELRSTAAARKTTTWGTLTQEIDFSVSFDDLLHRFCRTCPIPRPKLLDNNSLQTPGSPRTLNSQDVSYYTISRLLNVRICWTTSLCEHLELDIRAKTLKLFRVPSYCAMLSSAEKEKAETFLDRYDHLELLCRHTVCPKDRKVCVLIVGDLASLKSFPRTKGRS